MARNTKKKQKGPLIIFVTRDYDGCLYALPLISQRRIEELLPGARQLPMIFLGYRERADFEVLHAPLWNQMATMLTGLTPQELSSLGGVQLYDSREKSMVREWDPAITPGELATNSNGSESAESLSRSK